MSKSGMVFVVVIVLALFFAYSAAYTVQESEQVVIVRFGKVVGQAVTEPGLKFKMPFIDAARRFDKRWLEWDGDPNQITTLDKRYIHIDVFARWRISTPLVFIETLRDEQSAQARLDDIIDNATRNVVANHNLIELIRSSNREFDEADEEVLLTGIPKVVDSPSEELEGDQAETESSADEAAREQETEEPQNGEDKTPAGDENTPQNEDIKDEEKPVEQPQKQQGHVGQRGNRALYKIDVGREKLTRLILEKASSKAAQLGIELKDVQFKRIDYIESVQTKVFDRMVSERKRVAEAFRSQGRGRSAEILGRTEKELKKIRSEAYRRSEEIMGRADGEAAAIYANAYRRDPELYNFLKTLESYRETVDETSWIVLTTEADYASYLQKMKGY